jgi:hypothetical protein
LVSTLATELWKDAVEGLRTLNNTGYVPCGPNQVVSKLATELWKGAAEAYVLGRSLVLAAQGRALLDLLDDLEELLATNRCAAGAPCLLIRLALSS